MAMLLVGACTSPDPAADESGGAGPYDTTTPALAREDLPPAVLRSPWLADADRATGWLSSADRGGNHVVGAALRGRTVTRVPVPFRADTVLGAPTQGGTMVVLTADGADAARVWVLHVTEEQADGSDLLVERVPTGPATIGAPTVDRPALAAVDGGTWAFVPAPSGAATFHAPVPVEDTTVGAAATHAWVGADRRLHVGALDGADTTTPIGDLLADGRPTVGGGRIVALEGPTDLVRHGVLGDAIEAAAVAWVDVANGRVDRHVASAGSALETTSPLLAPNGDIVVVTSTNEGGARVTRVRPDDAVPIVHSDAIGTGGRWRHPVAATDDHVWEIVTPHLGKIVQRLGDTGRRLTADVEVPGAMSTHTIGSRDLDGAVLIDVDGDGVRELVGPDGDRGALVAVDVDGNAELLVDVGGRVTTNVAAWWTPEGTVLAVGTDDHLVILG